MTIDELRAWIAARTPAGEMSLEERRARLDGLGAISPLPPGWASETQDLAVPTDRWSGSEAGEGRAVLYLHGGAYVGGSPLSHRGLAAHLGRAAKAAVYLPDYRVAPEHPFPAAVEDCRDAYLALLDKGVAPERCVIAGESAGGGLTLATAVALRDAGAPLPAALAVISPWVNLAQEGESYEACADLDPVLTKARLDAGAAAYLAGQDPKTPLASPLFADLSGLPPLLIQVGSDEILLSDAEALRERARAAGVHATLELWPNMIHVWHTLYFLLEEGAEAIAELGGWIARRLDGRSPD